METITFSIESDYSVASQLNEDLKPVSYGEIEVAEKDNFDGSESTVLQIVQIITSLATAITPLISAYLDKRKVRKIKFDNIEIENPTQEQWQRVWQTYLSSLEQANKSK